MIMKKYIILAILSISLSLIIIQGLSITNSMTENSIHIENSNIIVTDDIVVDKICTSYSCKVAFAETHEKLRTKPTREKPQPKKELSLYNSLKLIKMRI
jgi:hypothetical protein